tara:strand:+ start:566 stop:733 length:168 start_codon:yes stop_codon:yes gene_type:complete
MPCQSFQLLTQRRKISSFVGFIAQEHQKYDLPYSTSVEKELHLAMIKANMKSSVD